MSFIVLANFKSHKDSHEVESWLKAVAPVAGQCKDKITTIVSPSFVHLPLTINYKQITSCAQDVSPFPPGAYTGAVNATQLKEYLVSYCLIGHSERRRYFHETATDVSNKARMLHTAGITPVICLAREDIEPQFAALDDDLQDQCLYCFEPPADIGGTVTAPLDHISQTTAMIKNYVDAPVLYGGSVTPDNIASLLPLALDGVLVASASLDPAHFNQILSQVAHAR